MKTVPVGFLILTLIIIAACVPNRLSDSLTTNESIQTQAVAPAPDGRNLQPQLGNANIDLGEVVTLLPPDAIRAILPDEVDDILISASEADAAGMRSDVRVLGVSINGESRAYPIPFMSEHEIVNDEVGGELIAATW